MLRSRAGLMIAVTIALTSCGSGARHDTTGPIGGPSEKVSSPGASLIPLRPSVPAVFRSGTNACGNPYALSATTAQGTTPLLDCPGLAGLTPTPTVDVAVGAEITVTGVPAADLTVTPGALVAVRGTSFIATRPGRTVVTVHDHLCVADRDGRQPTTCALFVISVG
jgi:hypothetical protein